MHQKTSVEKGSKPHWSKREFGIFILKRGKNENVLLVVSYVSYKKLTLPTKLEEYISLVAV
ncbi:hypothetical protein A4Q45_16160 [Listeria monocytogenes]|nr:hypothetical protein A4Q45_16160 [Listeria monocytogenes]